jgi:hypothetical protein
MTALLPLPTDTMRRLRAENAPPLRMRERKDPAYTLHFGGGRS